MQLIATYCHHCEHFTIAEVCGADVGCRRCRSKERWRERALSRHYRCPRGLWDESRSHPVKIAFVTPSLQSAGAERWVYLLASGLDQTLFQPTIIVMTGRQASHETVLARLASHLCPVATLRDDITPFFASRIAIIWGAGRLPEVLHGFTGQIVYVHHASTPQSEKMARIAGMYADHLVAVSEAAAQYCPQSRSVTVLHNGITVNGHVRTLSRRPTEVLFLGRLHEDKRPDLVAEAMAFLPQQWRLTYVGSATAEMRQRIHACCHQATFIEPVDDIAPVLAAADVLVLPSRHEAMSLTLLEAWAAGVPTVTTPVGAVPELERDYGPLTITVPVNCNPETLATAMRSAVHSDNTETVQRASRVTRRHFCTEAMVRRWTTFLLSVIRNDSPA